MFGARNVEFCLARAQLLAHRSRHYVRPPLRNVLKIFSSSDRTQDVYVISARAPDLSRTGFDTSLKVDIAGWGNAVSDGRELAPFSRRESTLSRTSAAAMSVRPVLQSFFSNPDLIQNQYFRGAKCRHLLGARPIHRAKEPPLCLSGRPPRFEGVSESQSHSKSIFEVCDVDVSSVRVHFIEHRSRPVLKLSVTRRRNRPVYHSKSPLRLSVHPPSCGAVLSRTLV